MVHWFGNHSCGWDQSAGNNDVTHFITVHDLLLFEESLSGQKNSSFSQRLSNRLKRQFHQQLYRRDAGRSNRVFVPISDFTAGQLNRYVGHGNIHSHSLPVYTSVPDVYKKASFGEEVSTEEKEKFCERYGISEGGNQKQESGPSHYLLYVAHFYPHKNHLRLLEAYEAYRRKGGKRSLVFRGDPIEQNCYERVKKRAMESDYHEDIHFIPRISVNEMQTLYATSAGMIFPSQHEGGGIPVMESLLHARPVACSRLPVFEEYYADIPHYINPDNTNSITEGLHWIDQEWSLLNSNAREQSRFLKQVEVVRSTFSQERMKEDLRQLYEQWVL